MLTSFMESSVQAADKKSQLEVIDEKAKSDIKFGLEDLDTLRTEVNKMRKRFGGLAKADKELGDRITKLELQIADLVIKLGKLSGPSPEIPGILSRIGKLEREGGVINGRLDKLEQDVATLKGDMVEVKDDIADIKLRLHRDFEFSVGVAAELRYGTSGSVSTGVSLQMEIQMMQSLELVFTGGVGGTHEGASGNASVSVRNDFGQVSAGVTFGIVANCDGLCTRLFTEIWGGGLDLEFRFLDGWFIRASVLFGSEWTKGPTTRIEYPDRTVIKTDDSREFGVEGSVKLGRSL